MRVFARVAERGSFGQGAPMSSKFRGPRQLARRRTRKAPRRTPAEPDDPPGLAHRRRHPSSVRARAAFSKNCATAEETLRDTRSKPQGKLRVDVPVAFGRYLLLPALPEFTRRYPLIELDLRLNDRVVDSRRRTRRRGTASRAHPNRPDSWRGAWRR